jgi:hypothetical protein
MKYPLLAALIGIGGLVTSGCSPADRGGAVRGPAAVAATATIRSQDDLQRYLVTTAISSSPLGALSSGARARFLSSLTFNQRGVTGFHYGDLQAELTASQIVAVLHLFGVERDVAIIPNVRVETASDRRTIRSFELINASEETDYKGYNCPSPGTCTVKLDSICTSNC